MEGLSLWLIEHNDQIWRGIAITTGLIMVAALFWPTPGSLHSQIKNWRQLRKSRKAVLSEQRQR